MCQHEQKTCPRCEGSFECKVGSILLCQCSTITLNDDERNYMQDNFSDCLCASCMKAVKEEYHQKLFKEKLNKISSLFHP